MDPYSFWACARAGWRRLELSEPRLELRERNLVELFEPDRDLEPVQALEPTRAIKSIRAFEPVRASELEAEDFDKVRQ